MKTKLLYSILFISTVLACRQDEDEALLGRPEDRMKEMLKTYQQQLVSSPHGWRGFVFPQLAGGFSFLFEFTSEGRVSMMADINDDCASESYESSYRMAVAQRPSVFFDTYSYLHILADPDPDTIGGATGQGLQSDFEFAFESVSNDTIRLKGNQHGTPMILIRATEEEAEQYKNGTVKTVMKDIGTYGEENPFLFIQSGDGKRLNTSFNLDQKLFALYYKQTDDLHVASVPFGYTPTGIFLREPVRYKGIEFQEVFYDKTTHQYYINNKGTRMNVSSSPEPVLPLNLLLGVDFSVISIPPQPIDGWSQIFYTIGSNIASVLVQNGLGLSYMELTFNPENNTMDFNVFFREISSGRYYLAQYPYSYTKSADGVFKFAQYDEPNANGEYLQPAMEPLLMYFDKYRFRMEYYQVESGEYVAQMKCIESAQFFFTGNFGSVFF